MTDLRNTGNRGYGANGRDDDRTIKILKRLLVKIAIYAVLTVIILHFVLGIHKITGNDMYPSLRDGDIVITYKLGSYDTGDVVAYEADGKIRFGRICALGGDVIEMGEDDSYTVNGIVPYEAVFYPTDPGEALNYPYTVGEDQVFIMGDMRPQAADSRQFGAIGLDKLEGKVILLLYRGRGF